MSTPVLVTGASGNVGRHVVARLLDAGAAVRAAVPSVAMPSAVGPGFSGRATGPAADGVASGSPPAGPTAEAHLTVEAVPFDFTDPQTWSAAFRGVERMFLLRPPHLSRVRRDMVPALEHARAAGVRHVVFLSLQGAEHNRVVPHRAVEDWLTSSGMTWTFVRASFFFQNLSTTHAREIRETGTIMVPAGRGRTAFVDARDVAAVAATALVEPGHENVAYTPTGEVALSYGEVASALSAALQRPIRYADPSPLAYVRHARRMGMPTGMVAVTLAIYTAARLGLADGLTDDVRRVTGQEPLDVHAFARDHVAAWRG